MTFFVELLKGSEILNSYTINMIKKVYLNEVKLYMVCLYTSVSKAAVKLVNTQLQSCTY